MKSRTIAFCCAALLVVGLAASHTALAGADNNGKKAEKINICHNGKLVAEKIQKCKKPMCRKGLRAEIVQQGLLRIYEGHIINVSANAAQAHLAHGDVTGHMGMAGEPGDACRYTERVPCIVKCVPIKKKQEGPKQKAEAEMKEAAK